MSDSNPKLTFDEYQKLAFKLAKYPAKGDNFIYPCLGMSGECGEYTEKVKKCLRDDGGVITPERKAAMLKELGDVLWYLSANAMELDVTLSEIAQGNIDKLMGRNERGTLQGSGDDR